MSFIYLGRVDGFTPLGMSAYEFAGASGRERVVLHPVSRWWSEATFSRSTWTVRERCNALQADFNSVWEMLEMARGGKRPAEAAAVFNKTVWVNVSLTVDDRKAIMTQKMSSAAVEEALMGLLGEGYKLSIFKEKDVEAVGAIMFDRRQGVPTQDWALSARAPSIQEALVVLLYKHYEKLQGDWRSHREDHPEELYG